MTTPTGRPQRLAERFGTRSVFLVLLYAGIFALAARDVTDPDVWWHLKTGQLIVEDHAVPRTDPFSFTRQGQRWVTHEWLSEVLIYGTYAAAGWPGLIVVFGLLTTASFVFLYLRCAGQPYAAGLVVVWAAFACRPTWGIRPQTLSMLLASIVLWLLDRREQQLFWIVPLILLWANLHAGYALGIALLGLVLVGAWLEDVLGAQPRDELRTRTLAKVLALSLLVVAVNPNGLRLYLYPFQTLASQAMQGHIAEWFSPNFHQAEYGPFLFMLLGLLVVASQAPDGLRPRELPMMCAAAFGALIAVRNIPIFVLVAGPAIASGASRFFGKLSQPARVRPRGLALGLHLAILAGVGAFVYSQTARVIRRQPATEARHFPAAAASFVLEQQPLGPIFNYYNWGGYLIWRLYPRYRVFIDGRADVYGDTVMRQFSETYALEGDWESPLDRWQINAVIVPADCPLAAALQTLPSWRVLFRDRMSLVMARQEGWQDARRTGDKAPVLREPVSPAQEHFPAKYATN
ncbi:MAG TPA: hypothetical protein VEI01_01330 [Terriglobales bacterium]|nr:hypothetical protein [Terriglobales bacterium]